MQVMQNNSTVPFVQRIMSPGDYPTLDNGDGSYSTHRMAWGKSGDSYIVFPTVQQDGKGLKDFGMKGGMQRAVQNKDYVSFDNADDADWFSQRYKAAWGGRRNEPPQ